MTIKKQNLLLQFYISSIITLILSFLFVMFQYSMTKAFDLTSKEPNIEVILDDDEQLINLIDHILPEEHTTLFDEKIRHVNNDKPPFETISLKEVLSKGKAIKFNTLYNNEKYSRPIYTPAWKDFYFRGWLYMPTKVSESRHKLFIFPLGASSAFDFTGNLGFDEKVDYDSHKNINLLLYNFKVKTVKEYENQIALIGEPSRTGASVISITQDELLPKGINEKLFLIQLSTPDGYEEDYIYGNAVKYDYLKKKIEENTIKTTAPFNTINSFN